MQIRKIKRLIRQGQNQLRLRIVHRLNQLQDVGPIVQKAWGSELQDRLKTESSEREVDLHPKMAAMLREHIGEETALASIKNYERFT